MNPLDPQPDPRAASGDLWADLILCVPDILRPHAVERRRQGIEKYGTPLQADNGRDPLFDAFQEEMDRIVYFYQYHQKCLANYNDDPPKSRDLHQRSVRWSAARVERAISDAAETAAEITRRGR